MNKTEHANRVTVLRAPYLSDLKSNSLHHLSKMLNKWLDSQGLSNESVDDLLCGKDLTDDQETWLREYRDAWNGLEQGVGSFIRHIEKGVDPDFLWALTNFQDNEVLRTEK